jgi:CSLREA domain-containing protein
MKPALPIKPIIVSLSLVLLAVLSVDLRPARAATITVTTTIDEINSDGDCSLREAIRAANINAPVDACTAGNGPDTIQLPAGIYILTIAGAGENAGLTGDLDITDELTIQGAGKVDTVISGNGLDRVFHILAPTQISDLTVGGGDSGADGGGGILAGHDLTIRNSRVRDNQANAGGGIYVENNAVTVIAIETRIFNNTAASDGGGIYNFGVVTLLNSLVSGNAASNGGGISSQKTVVAINSTFSGNDGGVTGGGIKVVGTTELYNVTIANNEAGTGGGVYIAGAGTLYAKNSIFSDNVDSAPGTQNADCAGTLNSLGYNLIGDPSGCTIVGTTGNIIGVSADLNPLQNNGGPTLTHALQPGSPAIDAGEPNDCTDADGEPLYVDQRGFARPVDGDGNGSARCDMGAYEYDSPGQPTATPTAPATPTQTNTPTPTATQTASATASPTASGTAPPTATPSATPTATTVVTNTPGPSPTNTPTASATPTGGEYQVFLPLIFK